MTRSYRILVVEDDPGDCYLIGEAFRQCGYPCEVLIVTSHDQAEERLAQQGFDIVLSDFGTNVPEAENFVRHVRTRYTHIPLVVLSGGLHVRSAYSAGASAFVKKESDLDAFFYKIKGIMNFWAGTAQLAESHDENIRRLSS